MVDLRILVQATCYAYSALSSRQPIKAAEDMLNTSRPEAAKYLPDYVKTMENALAAMKDKFAAGDYKTVIAEATGFTDQAKGLPEAAKAKKEELMMSWKDLNAVLPKMIEAIQSRVDNPSDRKKPSANLTKENLEEVMSALSVSKQDWVRAEQSYNAGNLVEAVSGRPVNPTSAKLTRTVKIPD